MSGHPEAQNILRESPPVVFVNSVAGGGRARDYLKRIQRLFESRHIQAQFVMTNSAAELESSAQNAILHGRRMLFAMGGDGTFQALANAAYDPVKAAEAILRGGPRFVDLVRVRTAEGRARLYAGGGGIGLDAEAARYASGVYRRFPGRTRYIASALRALAGFTPMEVHIEFPGSDIIPHKGNALLVAVLNSPTYGAGLRLAPNAVLDDGSLNVVLIEDIGTLGVLRLLPRLMGSGELRTSRVKRWKASRMRLTTNRPCLFHGDGEILGSTPVEIEVMPGALQVLAPARR